jgi:hypothetical protein
VNARAEYFRRELAFLHALTDRAQVNLTPAQLLLIRSAVATSQIDVFATPKQRAFISDVCAQAPTECDREKFLIAFKSAVVEATNELAIPFGSQRDEMIDRLISIFIGELYEGHRELNRSSVRDVTSTSRLEMKTDISNARI